MTEKDKKDIEFGIEHGVDFMAMSFVRDAGDVRAVAELVKPRLAGCGLVAKVESREAIENIDGIIEAADGVMIAPGGHGDCDTDIRGSDGAEADYTEVQRCGEVRDYGDADAGAHDRAQPADAGGGDGCCECDYRRDGFRDAVGGDGGGEISIRVGADDERYYQVHREGHGRVVIVLPGGRPLQGR